jgi:hypothetical protein
MSSVRAPLASLVVVLTTPSLSAQSTPDDPVAVVREYLQRGARGELASVRALVEGACHDTPIGRAEGVMVMGVRMTIRTIRAELLASSAAEARVRYTVTGAAQGATSTTTILGATVHIGRVRVANVTQSSVLRLVRANGRWLVTCR